MEGRIVAGRYCKLLDSVFLISGPAAKGIGFEQLHNAEDTTGLGI